MYHSIINFKNLSVSGDISIEILKDSWNTERIIDGLKVGILMIEQLSDASIIKERDTNKMVARINRFVGNIDFSKVLIPNIAKNQIMPYLFKFSSTDEFWNLFTDKEDYANCTLLFASKSSDQAYRHIWAYLKKDNAVYQIDMEVERSGTYFLADYLRQVSKTKLKDIARCHENKEYHHILEKIWQEL